MHCIESFSVLDSFLSLSWTFMSLTVLKDYFVDFRMARNLDFPMFLSDHIQVMSSLAATLEKYPLFFSLHPIKMCTICPIADDVHFQSSDLGGVCRVAPIYSYSSSLKINKSFIEGTLKLRTVHILHQTSSVRSSILFTDDDPHSCYYFDTQIA